MGRNIKTIQREIFRDLSERMNEACRGQVSERNDFIFLERKEYDVIEHARISIVTLGNESIMALIDYGDRRYVGIPETEYCEGFFSNEQEISEDEKTAEEIVNGIGILLFYSKVIDLRPKMTEIKIFDEILGIEDQLTCMEFLEKIEEFRVFPISEGDFSIKYHEDAKRLLCALVCKNKDQDELNKLIYDFTMMKSSRGVIDIIYSVTELKHEELIFLQLYRVLEYLFIIIRAKNCADKYSIDINTTVDLLIQEKIWFQEDLSVRLLVERSSSASQTDYCNYLTTIGIKADDASKTSETIARYIYEQRCKIAHYKYKHEQLKGYETLHSSSICFLKLITSIFSDLDAAIITINEENCMWEELETHYKW